MKKILVISTLALVVVGCVLAAGCINWDPIVGVWKLTEPSDLGIEESDGYDTYLTFTGNHVAYMTFSTADAEYSSSESTGIKLGIYNIAWYKLDDANYYVVYPTDEEFITLDTSKTKLTSKLGVYTKITT